MGWLKKVGHKISHGAKKLGKSVSAKRGLGAGVIGSVLTGNVLAGTAIGLGTGLISNAHNKHKAHKKHSKHKNSIFKGGCCGAPKQPKCGAEKLSPCGRNKVSGCGKHYNDYPMGHMNNNMMMGMFNNIINRLLSILQSFSSQPLNTYNNYNTYNTFSTTNNQNIYNTVYDNDVINNNIFGAGNSIYADA